MVWSSTCLVIRIKFSCLCIAPCLLKSTSAGACTAKTLCWRAVITAKQIFVKEYRKMVIIISKSRFRSISIDRISTSDDPNTTHAFYIVPATRHRLQQLCLSRTPVFPFKQHCIKISGIFPEVKLQILKCKRWTLTRTIKDSWRKKLK